MTGRCEHEQDLDLDDGDRWVLVFHAQRGDLRAGRRVAQVLKYALRTQGLRCVEARAKTEDEELVRLRGEVLELRRLVLAQAERIAGQSEALARSAEKKQRRPRAAAVRE